jgi:outer membrane protein assembly factor BamB
MQCKTMCRIAGVLAIIAGTAMAYSGCTYTPSIRFTEHGWEARVDWAHVVGSTMGPLIVGDRVIVVQTRRSLLGMGRNAPRICTVASIGIGDGKVKYSVRPTVGGRDFQISHAMRSGGGVLLSGYVRTGKSWTDREYYEILLDSEGKEVSRFAGPGASTVDARNGLMFWVDRPDRRVASMPTSLPMRTLHAMDIATGKERFVKEMAGVQDALCDGEGNVYLMVMTGEWLDFSGPPSKASTRMCKINVATWTTRWDVTVSPEVGLYDYMLIDDGKLWLGNDSPKEEGRDSGYSWDCIRWMTWLDLATGKAKTAASEYDPHRRHVELGGKYYIVSWKEGERPGLGQGLIAVEQVGEGSPASLDSEDSPSSEVTPATRNADERLIGVSDDAEQQKGEKRGQP